MTTASVPTEQGRRRFEDKVVFITGAARGQGREAAVRFAAEGANVIGVDLAAQLESIPYPMATPEDLATTVAQVEQVGGAMVSRVADVRDLAALEGAVAEGLERFGRLDMVVANAGVMATSLFTELSEAAWDEIVGTNVDGTRHLLDAITGPALTANLPTCDPGQLCMPNTASMGNCRNRPSLIISRAPPPPSSAGWKIR